MSFLVNPESVLLLGGFGEIIELCTDCGVRIEGVLVPTDEEEIRGIPVLGDDAGAADLDPDLKRLPLILGVGGAAVRRKLQAYYAGLGFRFASLVHPTSRVSPSARLGEGVILDIDTNVSTDVVIGDFAVLNTRANIMHDSTVGSQVIVAPNAVVLGRVAIGDDAYIGANCTILPHLTIGRGATVGAGAVVTRSVASESVVAGNPARELPRK